MLLASQKIGPNSDDCAQQVDRRYRSLSEIYAKATDCNSRFRPQRRGRSTKLSSEALSLVGPGGRDRWTKRWRLDYDNQEYINSARSFNSH